MKLILTLTKNEYIKLFRKKSTPILLLLVTLLVFGISLLKPARNYYSGDYTVYSESLEQQKANFENSKIPEQQIEKYTNISEKANAVIQNGFYDAQITVCDKAIELGVNTADDWRLPIVTNILNNLQFTYYYEFANSSSEFASYAKNINNEKGMNYEEIKKQQDTLWNRIQENNYSQSFLPSLTAAQTTLAAVQTKLDELESGTGDENTDFEIFKLKGQISCQEKIVKIYQIMMDKKFEYKSTEDKTVTESINCFNNAFYSYQGLISEKDYKNNTNNAYYDSKTGAVYNRNNDYTYEQYYKNEIKNIKTYEEKGTIGLYSLENNVVEMSVAHTARYKSLSFVHLLWILTPLAIFFASGMVAKEYSTKTINLLLIRPVKRWKILLSKYLCLLSLVVGMLVVTLGAYLLGSGIRLGFSDFAQPFLFFSDGNVFAVNFILWLLGKMLVASLPILCLISLTFMFSSVTKGNAVSLILGIITLFSSIFILFFSSYFTDSTIVQYFPFQYFSGWSYVYDNLTLLTNDIISIFSGIIKVDMVYGSILLLSLTAVSLLVAFTDFNKKDIK